MRAWIAILFLVSCAAPVPAPAPAATPPPPIRNENVAVAHGVITDAQARPVPFARIRAWAADPSCRAIGDPVTVHAGAAGTYQVEVVQGAGPQMAGCITMHIESGGSVVRAQEPVTFMVSPKPALLHLQLPRAPELTEQEAYRLTGLFTLAMRQEQQALEEVALYFEGGVDAARTAANEAAKYLRGAESFKLVEQSGESYTYELRGVQERTMRVTVTRGTLIRMRLSGAPA
jgi:hypothetical protein